MSLDAAEVDSFLAAVLLGRSPAWPWDSSEQAGRAVFSRAQFHGVEGLVWSNVGESWPQLLRQSLRQAVLRRAAWEMAHRAVLGRALPALDAAEVQPILIKGTATAYSLYQDPVLRTRGDTDILIREDRRAEAFEALAAAGFAKGEAVGGELASYQATFSSRGLDGVEHLLDVHWRINNSQVLASLLTHAEAMETAVPLPALGPAARTTSPPLSMLITAFHRATHIQVPYFFAGEPHHGGDRMIWLNDVHLLAQSFTASDWSSLCAQARRTGLTAICERALRESASRLGTAVPQGVFDTLSRERPGKASIYLAAGRPRQVWMELCALPSAGQRARFVAEHLFPPARYMRGKYAGARLSWLPWLYLRRAAGGLLKQLRSHSAQS